jgi:hypothetical protein
MRTIDANCAHAEYGWLNGVAAHLLAPLYGVPSGLYALHHRGMHHCEGNAARRDLSSTEPYQRDSLLHFVMSAASAASCQLSLLSPQCISALHAISVMLARALRALLDVLWACQ